MKSEYRNRIGSVVHQPPRMVVPVQIQLYIQFLNNFVFNYELTKLDI